MKYQDYVRKIGAALKKLFFSSDFSLGILNSETKVRIKKKSEFSTILKIIWLPKIKSKMFGSGCNPPL